MQVRAITYFDDHENTSNELWQFLRSKYTGINERDIQNIVLHSTRGCAAEGLIGMNI